MPKAEELLKVLQSHPELLEGPIMNKLLGEVEKKEAESALQGVATKIKEAILAANAEGVIKGEDLPKVELLRIRYDQESKDPVQVVIAARGSKGSGGPGVTSNAWEAAGFVKFQVKGRDFTQPTEAIEAAGGKLKTYSENYWRVILSKTYINLPIKAVFKNGQGEKVVSLEQAKELVQAHV